MDQSKTFSIKSKVHSQTCVVRDVESGDEVRHISAIDIKLRPDMLNTAQITIECVDIDVEVCDPDIIYRIPDDLVGETFLVGEKKYKLVEA